MYSRSKLHSNQLHVHDCMFCLLQPIVIVAAFVFAGVGFYSLSPDVFDTEFCCDGNHSLEGEMHDRC